MDRESYRDFEMKLDEFERLHLPERSRISPSPRRSARREGAHAGGRHSVHFPIFRWPPLLSPPENRPNIANVVDLKWLLFIRVIRTDVQVILPHEGGLQTAMSRCTHQVNSVSYITMRLIVISSLVVNKLHLKEKRANCMPSAI